jgi:plastocyanin
LALWQQALFVTIVAGLVFYGLLHGGLIKLPAARAHDCSTVQNTKTIQIQITNKAFEPGTIEAKLCDTLQFINTDKTPHDPAIGPHPTHTSYPGFDAKRGLQQGETYTFTLNRLGSYSFHDHLDDRIVGKLIVQK